MGQWKYVEYRTFLKSLLVEISLQLRVPSALPIKKEVAPVNIEEDMGRPQNPSGFNGEHRNTSLMSDIEHRILYCSACSLVSISTELSRFHINIDGEK
jgi:hypothetical protein